MRPANEVTVRLHAFYESRKATANVRADLVAMAIELGMDAAAANIGNNACTYLDGYLAGQGRLPQARR